MSEFTTISRYEMEKLLQVGDDGKPTGNLGFYLIDLPNTFELVYAKRVNVDLSLRVYSTIQKGGDMARSKGKDSIKVALFWKKTPESQPIIIGTQRKVLRVLGWRANLLERINMWRELIGPACEKCGAPTVERKARGNTFFGCGNYPACKGYGKQ